MKSYLVYEWWEDEGVYNQKCFTSYEQAKRYFLSLMGQMLFDVVSDASFLPNSINRKDVCAIIKELYPEGMCFSSGDKEVKNFPTEEQFKNHCTFYGNDDWFIEMLPCDLEVENEFK